MASKVYYMNDRATHGGESVPFKAVKLLRDAGLKDMVKPGATVGIKIHTGNYGNSATHFLNHPEFGLHSGVVNQEVAQQMMQARTRTSSTASSTTAPSTALRSRTASSSSTARSARTAPPATIPRSSPA